MASHDVRAPGRAAGTARAQAVIVSISSTIRRHGPWLRPSQPRRATPAPPSLPRFGLIVCARDEEQVIERVVTDLHAQEYPRELFDVIVVAHNCTTAPPAPPPARGLRRRPQHGTAWQGSRRSKPGSPRSAATKTSSESSTPMHVSTRLLAAVAAHAGEDDCLQAEPCLSRIRSGSLLATASGERRGTSSGGDRASARPRHHHQGCGWFIRPECSIATSEVPTPSRRTSNSLPACTPTAIGWPTSRRHGSRSANHAN